LFLFRQEGGSLCIHKCTKGISFQVEIKKNGSKAKLEIFGLSGFYHENIP
jgi:hypothetical protein